MPNYDSGLETVAKLSHHLLEETLKPARKQAEEIILEAEKRAEEIIQTAEHEKTRIVNNALEEAKKQKQMASTAINQSVRQTEEGLKQEIISHIFLPSLEDLLNQAIDEELLVKMLQKLLETSLTEKEVSVFCGEGLDIEKISALIVKKTHQSIHVNPQPLSSLYKGILVKAEGQNFSIEISSAIVRSLLENGVRRELRTLLFQEKTI